ncbi:MMPL family transporter [Rubripirellula sp.]|jgi:predicted RND superfamily exporter protein|nr:MMPL family transporter [Planctomycetaceae bacterium]MDA9857832.1 MMPL family transporter [Rubripirellula sp.]MDF1843487.1 MMPL family transporter [Rubripirellula sp.]
MSDGSNQSASRSKLISILILGFMAAAAPFVVYGARGALKSTSNDPRQWLPRSFAATDVYDWFEEQFGTDEAVVVSWPGANLEDPRIPQLADALKETEYFQDALTGPGAIADLEAGGMSRNQALRRMKGGLLGPDGKTTCIVLITSAAGRADRPAAIDRIISLAQSETAIDPETLKLAGPTVDAAAIDAESRKLLFQLAGFSALISFIVASLRMKSFPLAIMVLAVAGYSTGVSLAILFYSGGKMNLLMTMLPPLIYVLSISSAVHLANYYRDAASHLPTHAAVKAAVAHGWTPCMLAAVTTAIGLVSLVLSKIDPIRAFGVYAAAGVVASVLVLFVMLPAALHLFPPGKSSIEARNAFGRRIGNRAISFIARQHLPLMLFCLTFMGLAAWAIPSIRSTVKLQDRFLESSDMIADYRWLEENIGPMVPLEIVLQFEQSDSRTLTERMKLVAKVQSAINGSKKDVSTMSALNVLPPVPRSGSSVRSVIEREVINRDSTEYRLSQAHFLTDTETHQLWRITVRAPAIGDLDYGYFAEELRREVDPLLADDSASAIYTGVIPLIYKAQRQLLQDLVRSFLAAFGVIAVVLILVLRSVSAALLAMIPNLFPAVIVFGGLEWCNIPVQIGSVMTASAALGIAVDDTVHFLTWFRRGLDSGYSRIRSLHIAFRRCAGAMTHTTFICASGLLVFAISTFVPILHFAWLMVFLLLAALLGDLVLLPAILAGPLGRFFESGFLGTFDKMPIPEEEVAVAEGKPHESPR